MQTYTTPGERHVPDHHNAVAMLVQRAHSSPAHPAVAYRDGDSFKTMSTADLWVTVRKIAAGLVSIGVERGDRISLHTSTRLEFTLFDYAIWAAGAATTTIYETSSSDQIEWIISDSGSRVLITESADTRSVYESIEGSVNGCQHVFTIDEGAVDQLSNLATEESLAEVDRRVSNISHDDLATLVYTSGTTGMPKGCELTHYNFAWEVEQLDSSLGKLISEGNRTLMFLPLAHIFARAVQSACISGGATLGYSTGIPNLIEEMGMFKPTWVFSVPRVFEKIYNGAKQNAEANGKGKIFDRAAAVAINYAQGLEHGKVGATTKAAHKLFDVLVYSKIRALFGGDVQYAISGGAPLGSRLGYFFRGIGVTPLEGYGLTETTAGATVNTPEAIRIGTVGRPIQGTSIKIAEDGEVLIKGGQVFRGYWKNEIATNEALKDGWFHSGDLGALDNDGFLTITGRKKEIIVTAAGKNVAPAILEDRLRSHALVSQVMVVGDARPFIAALITLDEEALPAWTEANGLTGLSREELATSDELRKELDAAVTYANKAVSKAEAIKTYRILNDDFTIETGELTPTLKVKRSVVASKYSSEIDAIYEG